jgi:hypothetical protein
MAASPLWEVLRTSVSKFRKPSRNIGNDNTFREIHVDKFYETVVGTDQMLGIYETLSWGRRIQTLVCTVHSSLRELEARWQA